MKMIGMLTFYWADDFGALLQCYGLKTYLSQFEKTVVIPYYPKALRSRYRLMTCYKSDKLRWKVRMVARQLCTAEFYSSLAAKLRMAYFRRLFLKADFRKLDSAVEIPRYWQEISTYVVGSDQVWNPEITEGVQEGYFCEFPKSKSVRCTAYAASIGSSQLNASYDHILTRYLKNFHAISIRENASGPYISALYGMEPETAVDPVFLLEKKEWECFVKNRVPSKKRYIAVYDTEYNEEMKHCITDLRKRLGLPVVGLRAAKRYYDWGVQEEYIWGCGVQEFLEHLYHAEYVVTNSFHGTAMSIIFHKQFITFTHSERNTRLTGLLRAAGLERRMAYTMQDGVRIMEEVDWKRADEALKKEINRSKEFIRREILLPH